MKALVKNVVDWTRAVVRGFLSNHCSMHAAGLTYYALLAIVPILCVLLLTAKTLGAGDLLKAELNRKIDAMITSVEAGQDDDLARATTDASSREQRREMAQEFGRRAREITDQVFERVEHFSVGTLGLVGFVMLLWTVISSIGMVEVSFNEIWGVERPRPVWTRAYLYLFVSVVVPVLATLAMSIPILGVVKDVITMTAGAADATKWLSDGLVWFLDSTALRLALVFTLSSLTFAFLYWVMPNCRVRFRAAVYGGMITAFFFGAWVKICAVAQIGIAKSSTLYGSLAFLPIVLAWMYMSWQIILLGACAVREFEKLLGAEKKRPVTIG